MAAGLYLAANAAALLRVQKTTTGPRSASVKCKSRATHILYSPYAPAAQPVLLIAAKDAGAEVVRAVHSATRLLLAWALRNAQVGPGTCGRASTGS